MEIYESFQEFVCDCDFAKLAKNSFLIICTIEVEIHMHNECLEGRCPLWSSNKNMKQENKIKNIDRAKRIAKIFGNEV